MANIFLFHKYSGSAAQGPSISHIQTGPSWTVQPPQPERKKEKIIRYFFLNWSEKNLAFYYILLNLFNTIYTISKSKI